jgi:acyl-coenzyme A thioesterase PaaI-like protein
MNERTFSWHLPEDAVQKLVSLDKKDRREFFSNLPINNVPIGSLMDFSNIFVDDKGQVSFYIVPQEFHYNPLGTVHGGLAATILDSCNSISANCQLDKGFFDYDHRHKSKLFTTNHCLNW